MIAATPGYDLKNGAGGIGRPRALLFDWDNTLVDNWDVITDAMNAVYDAFGMPRWTIEEAKARIRSSMRDSFPKTFGERAKEAGRIFSDYFAAHHLERLREMPGAGGLLRGLAGSGLHLGVVSNKRGRFLRLEAERLGWTGHFGRLVGAADAPVDKPAVEPVDLALAESGIPRGRRCLVRRRHRYRHELRHQRRLPARSPPSRARAGGGVRRLSPRAPSAGLRRAGGATTCPRGFAVPEYMIGNFVLPIAPRST